MDQYLTKQIQEGVPVYSITDDFYIDRASGLYTKEAGAKRRIWVMHLMGTLHEEFPEMGFLYRGVKGTQLDDVLSTGSDIPEVKIGDVIFASEHMGKASTYGHGMGTEAQPDVLIRNSVCMQIYDDQCFEVAGQVYEKRFLTEPRDALLAVCMLIPK